MKSLQHLLLVLICLLCAAQLSAQQTPTNKLSLSLGGNYFAMLDQQASPLTYQSFGAGGALAYSRFTDRSIFETELGLIAGTLRPLDPELRLLEKTPFASQFIDLRFSYLRHVLKKGDFSLYAGGSLNQGFAIDFANVGLFPWGVGQGGLFAKARLTYELGSKHQVAAEASYPLVAWITRLPYSQVPRVDGKVPGVSSLLSQGTRLSSPADYQRVDLSLGYTYALSDRWEVGASYDWFWFRDAQPKELRAYSQQLMLTLSRNW